MFPDVENLCGRDDAMLQEKSFSSVKPGVSNKCTDGEERKDDENPQVGGEGKPAEAHSDDEENDYHQEAVTVLLWGCHCIQNARRDLPRRRSLQEGLPLGGP